jgi:hypothetical protein
MWSLTSRGADASAALQNFVRHLKKTFATKSAMRGHQRVRCVRSFHEFEIRQLPRLVEERLKRTIREFGHPNSGDML